MDAAKPDRSHWLQGPLAQCSILPSPAKSSVRLILLGAPGVGKGTQAELLHDRLGACHLSTGDVFRAAAKSNCSPTPALREARDYMQRGALVPDSTVWEMVRERSGCLHCGGGFILDGFPRTVSQAESLKQFMEDEKLSLSAVVDFELPLDEIVSRLSGRRTCESCGAVFHLLNQPPKQNGICDHCTGRLYQREDDQPESIKVRLEAYRESTAPLIEFYSKLGLLVSIAAEGTPEEIFQRTIAALDKAGVPVARQNQ